jgi:MoaA/NifB/PqqE/SkfB family radical SAM enzyme
MIDEAANMGWNGPIHLSHYSEPLLDPRIFKFAKYAADYGMVPELFTNGILLTSETIKKVDGLFPYVILSFRTPGDKKYWQSQFKKSRVRTTENYAVLIWGPDKELLHKSIDDVRDEPCINQPFIAFRINYNGQMSMCYADLNNEFGLLNAFEHSLEELWFGEEHTRAIQALSQRGSRQKFNLCRQCPRVFPDGGTRVKVNKNNVPPASWFRVK